jgi:methyltransferase
MAVSSVGLAVVLALMLVELRISLANERHLRRLGAVEAPDEVYQTMRWAYPGSFVAMSVEGLFTGAEAGPVAAWGLAVFVVAKGLKAWAIGSLGRRWTYRVFVLPDAPLVTHGPYAFMRHPNYVAVVGELVGMALMTGARIMGPVTTIAFATLLRRRIRAEELALGIQTRHPT